MADSDGTQYGDAVRQLHDMGYAQELSRRTVLARRGADIMAAEAARIMKKHRGRVSQ